MRYLGLLFAVAVALCASPAIAQRATTTGVSEYLSVGPAVGFGNAWVGNLPGVNKRMPTGYAGVSMIYSRNPHWGLGGQIGLSFEGYNVDYSGLCSSAVPLYLRMPLRGYYFFGNRHNMVRPNIYLGPSFGLKLGETDNIKALKYDNYYVGMDMGTFRTFDFGLNGGAGVNIKVAKTTWLNLDLGYYQGLADALKNDPYDHYNVNHNLTFNVGFLMGVR
jgi:Outer membrane protein beta-barrel domain